jgi:copper chaperone CopZ
VVTSARRIPGVTAVSVDHSSATLTLRFDPARTDDRAVAAAVQVIVDQLE